MQDDVTARCGLLFDSGLYCAESVLLSVAEALKIHSPLIPRIATGLCGGTARTGGACGAVNGGVLALGLAAGRDSAEEVIEASYEPVRAFLELFVRQFGTTSCPDLIGCDLGTPQGRAIFKEKNLREKCRQYTVEAARMVLQVIADRGL